MGRLGFREACIAPFLCCLFNLEQTEGIPSPTFEVPVFSFTPIEKAERIVQNMPNRPEIIYGGNRASYTPAAPAQVSDTFQFLMKETKEMFLTLHLDGKNRIICMDIVSIGSLNQSIVHMRSVFMTACLSSAAAIICVHNHPTGDPTPSSEDIAITRRLKEAGEIMGIKLLDHIIVGDGEYLSFVERGLL